MKLNNNTLESVLSKQVKDSKILLQSLGIKKVKKKNYKIFQLKKKREQDKKIKKFKILSSSFNEIKLYSRGEFLIEYYKHKADTEHKATVVTVLISFLTAFLFSIVFNLVKSGENVTSEEIFMFGAIISVVMFFIIWIYLEKRLRPARSKQAFYEYIKYLLENKE